ncbi:hypothetical protein CC86DRAFT_16667 [Ophiobolus disseminans]|uniref:Uncharacterized protein n=1 Tax=Ophiobolus disseminans TaxID=1469910 RepID=A0A6A7AL90_9PLEO|nr:hypothetical protein CC86DRAFT_16667 [Ophiobolus disseminans]
MKAIARSPKQPLKRKRSSSISSDEEPRANTNQSKKTPNTNAEAPEQDDEASYTHGSKDWGLNAIISSEYHVIDIEDVTTSKMHHICISLAFSLERNHAYKPPQDGTKEHDFHLDISKTPEGRDVTSITTLLKAIYLTMPQKRYDRTLIVTIVSLRKATPTPKPIQPFIDFEAPAYAAPDARACATYLIFTREEPSDQVRESEPSPLDPVFSRACPESVITTLPALKLKTVPIRWVELKSSEEKYKIEDRNGDKWHHVAAVGFRTVLSPFDSSE